MPFWLFLLRLGHLQSRGQNCRSGEEKLLPSLVALCLSHLLSTCLPPSVPSPKTLPRFSSYQLALVAQMGHVNSGSPSLYLFPSPGLSVSLSIYTAHGSPINGEPMAQLRPAPLNLLPPSPRWSWLHSPLCFSCTLLTSLLYQLLHCCNDRWTSLSSTGLGAVTCRLCFMHPGVSSVWAPT